MKIATTRIGALVRIDESFLWTVPNEFGIVIDVRRHEDGGEDIYTLLFGDKKVYAVDAVFEVIET